MVELQEAGLFVFFRKPKTNNPDPFDCAKDRLKIVAINIEEREVFREVSNVLKDFTITITNDPKKYAAQNYGVKGIPHMVIIGKDGKVVTAHAGYSEAALDGLLAEINAELAKG